ncbi:MAG: sigma-70 family RNA polymerase sigma factor [Armatimonadota bacterium]
MDELKSLVDRARSGDLDAFGMIVGRFQDMALAYAYSVTGDFHLAEDAAQEAFIQAYRDLDALREPDAFPGWFRKIIFKHCDRIKRKRHQTVPLESVIEVASNDPGPAALAEAHEMREMVLKAISTLSESERIVTTLFYINGYSQKDVAEFLEVPVSTVNNRLHSSRTRLKERMVQMVNDELKTHALPKDFPERIRKLLELPRPLEIEGHPIRKLWEAFRSCFPDFEEVTLDEVCEREELMLELDIQQNIVDEHRILRPELTSQLANFWINNGGGPCKLITVGRVFRPADIESETRLEVFHQAEVLWAEEGMNTRKLDETMRRVAAKLVHGAEFRPGSTQSYLFVGDVQNYEVLWRNKWMGIAGGGIAQDEWLIKAGLDPSRFGVVSFAFGLERCAQVKLDLDDIRKLWHPPYVPEG